MPTGFIPARGKPTGDVDEKIPTSAFSRGDVLVYDSSSSLSRWDAGNPSAGDIAGVALADSTDSINNLVPYLKPASEDIFLARIQNGSSDTPGFERPIEEDGNGQHRIDTDATANARVVIERGPADVPNQSVESRVLCRFITNAGNVEHS